MSILALSTTWEWGVSVAPPAPPDTSPQVPLLAAVQERLAPLPILSVDPSGASQPQALQGITMEAGGSDVSPVGGKNTLLLPVLQALEVQPLWMMGTRSSLSRRANEACSFRSACLAAEAISAHVFPNCEQPSSAEFGVLGVEEHAEPKPCCSAKLSTWSHTCRNSSRSAVTWTKSLSAASSRARSIGVGCSSMTAFAWSAL